MRVIKRPAIFITISALVLIALYYSMTITPSLDEPKPIAPNTKTSDLKISNEKTVDAPFMPKMANETVKAELGRSSWRLFHTILARYPDKPTQQERETLDLYIQLFAKVYPCGDCAQHFSKLLEKYPPQTASRQIASVWGCDLHNKVNKRLGKAMYDCTKIIDDYDCGCADDEKIDKVNDDLKFEVQNEEKQLGG